MSPYQVRALLRISTVRPGYRIPGNQEGMMSLGTWHHRRYGSRAHRHSRKRYPPDGRRWIWALWYWWKENRSVDVRLCDPL